MGGLTHTVRESNSKLVAFHIYTFGCAYSTTLRVFLYKDVKGLSCLGGGGGVLNASPLLTLPLVYDYACARAFSFIYVARCVVHGIVSICFNKTNFVRCVDLCCVVRSYVG